VPSLSKLTRRRNDPLASVVNGNHIAADLSQSLAEQIRPSVDLAAQVSSSFSATPAIANMSALSQTWKNPLLTGQYFMEDMIKGLTVAGSMPELVDQLAAAMAPSTMPELYRGGFAARFAQAYDAGSTSKQAIKALTKINMPPLVPTTTVPKFDWVYGTPTIDITSLFADVLPASDLAFTQQTSVSDVLGETRQRLADLFSWLNTERYRNAVSLPSNWDGIKMKDYGLLEQLLLDEGLALAWVVEPELLTQLISAESAFKRREMLAEHWKEIIDRCYRLLEAITLPALAEWRGFALNIAAALNSGHAEAAQALAANLIETMLIKNFGWKKKSKKMAKGKQSEMTPETIHRCMVYSGLRGVFSHFPPDDETKIPSKLSRHASAHAVSTTQYTLTNSLIAFMHVVAYLCLWQEGDIEEKAV
jgi:hypothetical protein